MRRPALAQLAKQLCDQSLLIGGERCQCGSGYFCGNQHGRLGHLSPAVSERNGAAAAILRIIESCNKTAQVQAINHTFYSRGV
jgi:hypothetical protein